MKKLTPRRLIRAAKNLAAERNGSGPVVAFDFSYLGFALNPIESEQCKEFLACAEAFVKHLNKELGV